MAEEAPSEDGVEPSVCKSGSGPVKGTTDKHLSVSARTASARLAASKAERQKPKKVEKVASMRQLAQAAECNSDISDVELDDQEVVCGAGTPPPPPLEVPYGSEAPTVACEVLPVDEEGFQRVFHKELRRRISHSKKEVDRLNQKLTQTKGLFRVILGVKDGEDSHQAFPLARLCRITMNLKKLFPKARPSTREGFVDVWVDSMVEVAALLELDKIEDLDVAAKCTDSTSFWGQIRDVDPGFTEEELLEILRSDNNTIKITKVFRPTYKRSAKGGKSVSVPTNRLLIQFAGCPPSCVHLCHQIFEVTLYARPPQRCHDCGSLNHLAKRCSFGKRCFNCGKQGHVSSACPNHSWCVNCREPHPSGSGRCIAFQTEFDKRKLLLEHRALHVTRLLDKSAVLCIDPPKQPEHLKTYVPTVGRNVSWAQIASRSIVTDTGIAVRLPSARVVVSDDIRDVEAPALAPPASVPPPSNNKEPSVVEHKRKRTISQRRTAPIPKRRRRYNKSISYKKGSRTKRQSNPLLQKSNPTSSEDTDYELMEQVIDMLELARPSLRPKFVRLRKVISKLLALMEKIDDASAPSARYV